MFCLVIGKVLEGIDALPARKRLTVTPKLVGQQIASQKAAAGRGPSGWRNSHLAVLYTDAAGPVALAAWSNVWARGRISPWLVSLWTSSLARPFYKTAQCEGIRPILQSEALLKFAFGCCTKGCQVELRVGAGHGSMATGDREELTSRLLKFGLRRPCDQIVRCSG